MHQVDPLLLRAACAGDAAAAEQVILRCRAPLRKILTRKGIPRERIDDVANLALAHAYRSLSRFDPRRTQLATWLGQIAVNVYLKELRYQSGKRRIPSALMLSLDAPRTDGSEEAHDLPDPSPTADPHELLRRKELVRMAHELISRLPDPQRRMVSMFYLEELTKPEIAQRLGTPLHSVRMELMRAMRTLRQTVGYDGERWPV